MIRAILAAGSEEQLFRALETKLGPGVRLTATGATFEEELSFEQWAAGLKYLVDFHLETERAMEWLQSLRFCGHCNRQLPETSTTRRLYCSEGCRVAAHRRRRVGVDPKAPKQPGKKLSPKT